MKNKLKKLIEKYDLYPDKVIFSKVGFGWIATDHDKLVEIDANDFAVLESFGSNTIMVYVSGDYLEVCVEMLKEEDPLLIASRGFIWEIRERDIEN